MLRALLLLALFLAAPARAQDDELPPDEASGIVALYVARGEESLREGNWEEARLRFRKAIERDPKNREARLGTIEAHRAVGAYDKARDALEELFAHHPGDRAGRVVAAELDLLEGRTASAREKAREAMEGGGEGPDLVGMRARLVLAEAYARNGARDEARDVLDFFLDHYERRLQSLAKAAFDAERLRLEPDKARPIADEMTTIAAALRLYVELSPLDHSFVQNALDLVNYARQLDPDHWEAWIEYVRITRLERENAIAKAHKAQQHAEERNPELADLYVAVAKSVMHGFNQAEAFQLVSTALKVNPKQTDARAIAARVLLEDNRYSEADDHIRAGLSVNPNHRDLLALEATLLLLQGEEEAFEEGMQRMLAVDPKYGEGFHLAGLVVAARQRRYDRAVELVTRGLSIDPLNFEAHATRGIFLANLGREQESRDALAKSRELFPFSHPIRDNFKHVLDHVVDSMTRMRTEHFVFRMDPSEHEILAQFLPPLMEGCWADMVDRYGFTPRAPVLVEVFNDANDFSVRTLGLPGIPALGACFGGLITLDSPQALPPGSFLWASTARHEFAHVMSLQLSGGRVPRWFTEGLSVLEEKPLDTGWGRDETFERQVYDAYHTDSLPAVASFDALFRTPRVAYAYYVGGIMLQFLQERSGEEGIHKALRLYGEDRPMDEVFREAFGLELEDFDRRFRDYVGARVSRYALVPDYGAIEARLRGKLVAQPNDGESLLRMAWVYYRRGSLVDAGGLLERARRNGVAEEPRAVLLEAHLARSAQRTERARELYRRFFDAGGEDFDARMQMAAYHLRDGETDAYVESLKRAKEAWPLRVRGENPYDRLRAHYLETGNTAGALRELEEQTAIASQDLEKRLELAFAYRSMGRDADAVRALEEALRITLFDVRVHEALLPLYRAAGEKEKARRAASCIVSLKKGGDSAEEAADAWLTLAEVHLENGDAEEARAAIREAERLAPELDRVRELKERAEGR